MRLGRALSREKATVMPAESGFEQSADSAAARAFSTMEAEE
jgi:hypothetical protein